jgi:hypothetical protein
MLPRADAGLTDRSDPAKRANGTGHVDTRRVETGNRPASA